MVSYISVSVLFLVASLFFAVKAHRCGSMKLNTKLLIWVLLGAAFVFRLIMGYSTSGFGVDINLFKAWGQSVNDVGYMQVYHTDLYLDYPPGFLYILGWMDSLRRFFGWSYDSAGYTLLIKLPSIISDLVCAWAVYHIGKKKFSGEEAFFGAAAYLFCPAVIINSTVWGQVDSFSVMILLFSLWLMMNNKFLPAGLLYGVALITKMQMLIFAPVYIFYCLFRKDIKNLFVGILSAVFAALLIAKPYTQGFDFTWLIDRYKETMDYYSYYSINAYNVWDMFGKNWAKLPEKGIALSVLNMFGPVIATFVCGCIMFFAKDRKAKESIFVSSAVIMFTVFMFSVKMHERYVYPALIFILLTYYFTKNRNYLLIFSGLSFVHFLNVAYVLWLDNSYVSPTSWPIVSLSAAHVVIYLLFMASVISEFILENENTDILSLLIKNEEPDETAEEEESESEEEPAEKPKFALMVPTCETQDRKIGKADVIICLAITVLYGVIAFHNLGVKTSANTGWEPASGESAVLMADGDISKITILPGISKTENNYHKVGCNISIDASSDGKSWTAVTTMDSSAVYEWKEIDIDPDYGRYIRVTANDDGVVLNEVGFIDVTGEALCMGSDIGGNAPQLVDEQGSVPVHTSYINSTYFDEIYHARTAYEFILGAESYENTHPTLGKLIISLGIRMFGMNPFGWRFMGTLFGVLMLPILYHFLKRLFGNTILSAAGVILFAFDFMHFTQTRIATIDTYAVIFILLMYDAMLVFIQQDVKTASKRQLLVPLFVSGVFMGIGCASKWTCCYAAVGLAVMFFAKLINDAPKNKQERYDYVTGCIYLCIWCMLFFVFIPVLIYFAAFLPLTLLPHNRYDVIGRFVSYQTHMFNYHSQLVAEHYFASPWYEWPLDIRNIWYTIEHNVDGMGGISTISCMGNPLLWWTGLAAMLFTVPAYIIKRKDWSFTVIIGFAAAYVPWCLVPRLTFVYHYFTAVPFIVMAIIGAFHAMGSNRILSRGIINRGVLAKAEIRYIILALFVLVNLALFAVFYPVISGAPTTQETIDMLSFMPEWYFG
ncbi:MAG: glycosyltransferase family 39 protein [Clostridia bacterium]|nr:glycosyltransferase family 39 protein [Clostridia bacterium]